MEDKNRYQAELFSNRLSKRFKQLRKWARRNRITCYRLYDRDIPEIPLAADLYEFLPVYITTPVESARFMQQEHALQSANDRTAAGEIADRQWLQLFLYERPYTKSEEEEQHWLEEMTLAASTVLHISTSHIVIKTRKHDKGGSQYGTYGTEHEVSGIVQEQGQLFRVNLSTHLDTGLFFDHRPLRSVIRDTASGKNVLNLYCYTASFSVYAAEGRARKIESVDLSNTYLSMAEENMKLNGFEDQQRYLYTRADVTDFLERKAREKPCVVSPESNPNRWNIIILDPPTFSNSKKTAHMFDINRDWLSLVNKCLGLLIPGGVLYFSTNSRHLTFDTAGITTAEGRAVNVEDITEKSIPEDFLGCKPHRCWKLTVNR
jgi:23S rRNA (cytosine1962-C5)-methyltransferase